MMHHYAARQWLPTVHRELFERIPWSSIPRVTAVADTALVVALANGKDNAHHSAIEAYVDQG